MMSRLSRILLSVFVYVIVLFLLKVHRAMMTICTVMVIAGFVLIWVHVKRLSKVYSDMSNIVIKAVYGICEQNKRT